MSFGIIYRVTNLKNGKIYIGQTTNTVEKRWIGHQSAAKRPYSRYQSHFINAIRKYGAKNFIVEVIDYAESQAELDWLETNYIKQLKTIELGYNSTTGGEHPNWTKKARHRLSESVRHASWKKKTAPIQRLIDEGFDEEEILWITGRSREELEQYDFCDKNDQGFFMKEYETDDPLSSPKDREKEAKQRAKNGRRLESLWIKVNSLKAKGIVKNVSDCNPALGD